MLAAFLTTFSLCGSWKDCQLGRVIKPGLLCTLHVLTIGTEKYQGKGYETLILLICYLYVGKRIPFGHCWKNENCVLEHPSELRKL